jgi:hypothetical protein
MQRQIVNVEVAQCSMNLNAPKTAARRTEIANIKFYFAPSTVVQLRLGLSCIYFCRLSLLKQSLFCIVTSPYFIKL